MKNSQDLEKLVGPAAFGIKMGVILPETDVKEKIMKKIKEVDNPLLNEGDTLCITENILARF